MSYHSYTDTQDSMVNLAKYMTRITFEDMNSVPQARRKADKILAERLNSKFMRDFLIQNIYKDKDGLGTKNNFITLIYEWRYIKFVILVKLNGS